MKFSLSSPRRSTKIRTWASQCIALFCRFITKNSTICIKIKNKRNLLSLEKTSIQAFSSRGWVNMSLTAPKTALYSLNAEKKTVPLDRPREIYTLQEATLYSSFWLSRTKLMREACFSEASWICAISLVVKRLEKKRVGWMRNTCLSSRPSTCH